MVHKLTVDHTIIQLYSWLYFINQFIFGYWCWQQTLLTSPVILTQPSSDFSHSHCGEFQEGELPAPTTGNTGVSFVLRGLLWSWAHLTLKARAASSVGDIMAPIITSPGGYRDSCINVPASYLSKGGIREQNRDPIASRISLHNTPVYWIFLPLCLSLCSHTHASYNHLPNKPPAFNSVFQVDPN